MSKLLLVLSIIYLAFVGWIASFFPMIIFVSLLIPFSNININVLQIASFLIVVGLVWKNCRKHFSSELRPEGEWYLLINIAPEKYNKIQEILKDKGIKKPIKLYVINSNIKNAECEVNFTNAYIVFNSALINADEFLAVFYHELHHIKNWWFYFLNSEICLLYNRIWNRISIINGKANRNIFLRLINIQSLSEVFTMVSFIFYTLLLILFNAYRMMVDEVFADMYSVDITRSTEIINAIKNDDYIESPKNPMNELFYNSHLHPKLRVKLIRKYYYMKYFRTDWIKSLKKGAFIVTLAIVLCVVIYNVFEKVIPIISTKILHYVSNEWLKLFEFNENMATLSFGLLLSGIGVVWNIYKLIKERNDCKPFSYIARRLGIISICIFCGTAVLMAIVDANHNLFMWILIVFLVLICIFGNIAKKETISSKKKKNV